MIISTHAYEFPFYALFEPVAVLGLVSQRTCLIEQVIHLPRQLLSFFGIYRCLQLLLQRLRGLPRFAGLQTHLSFCQVLTYIHTLVHISAMTSANCKIQSAYIIMTGAGGMGIGSLIDYSFSAFKE